LAESLLEISREERGLKIHGYVAPPADSARRTNGNTFFLNGRFIATVSIAAAVREPIAG